MKIIIVGCGKVGYAIARQMEQEKHDIVMVDNEIAHLTKADNTLDVMCIHGSGASISVLMDADVRSADLVIAVTGVDDTNMVCCLMAKSLGAATPSPVSATPSTAGMRTSSSGRSGWIWSSTPIWRRRRRSPVSSAFPPPSPWSRLLAASST